MRRAPSKKKTLRLAPTRTIEDPLAITSTGIVLVNAVCFDGVDTADDALRRALREPSAVFVGVALRANEVRFVLDHLRGIIDEPAGFVVGRRQRQRKS